MELHLDLVGGLAGDMFIASLLDAFPQHEARVHEAINSVNTDYRVTCSVLPHRDHVLQGRRFEVRPVTDVDALYEAKDAHGSSQVRPPLSGHATHHGHVTWESIRTKLVDATNSQVGLNPGLRRHALGIFQLLADAEAFVHGVTADSVEFHEVGAWDSVADIVGAAALIDAIGATHWSASPAPLGFGQVKTAHGVLPIPAPATTRLLMGMPTFDDGIGGERVTPTGAAILRYLCPPGVGTKPPGPRILVSSGTGFGQRKIPGLSNHVRVLCFENNRISLDQREITVLEFEVDDQSGEDLAMGLDRLRAHAGVLDVTQAPVFGKKGRMMMHVCILVRGAFVDAVVTACFRETTTIGLRHRSVQGIGLKRHLDEIEVDGQRLRVKVVERPGGATAKAESDDICGQEVHARRATLRRRAERAALYRKQPKIHA